MKLFIERDLSLASEKEKNRMFSPAKSTTDQPGHSSKKLTGKSHEGKPEVHHKFENALFEDKANEVTLTFFVDEMLSRNGVRVF